MNTYFISTEDVNNNEIIIKGDLHHHLTKVLRLQVGQELHFSDNQTTTYDGEITEINKQEIRVVIRASSGLINEPPINTYLIQCLPRGDKMEQIIQKNVELGVYAILAVPSDNSQIRLKNKIKEKEERFGKIAAAAAEQCGRSKIPVITVATSLEKAVESLPIATKIIFCYEKEGKYGLKSELIKVSSKNIALIIGPEGGFSPREAQLITERGGVAVTMGPRILRTETAGSTGLSAVMFELGDWGCFVEN